MLPRLPFAGVLGPHPGCRACSLPRQPQGPSLGIFLPQRGRRPAFGRPRPAGRPRLPQDMPHPFLPQPVGICHIREVVARVRQRVRHLR